MDQAILTTTLTLVGGTLLFAISEFMRGLFIQPILRLRALVGNVVDKVIYYSADLTSGAKIAPEREKEIREELRALSTSLRANEQMLPLYNLWATFRLVPNHSDIEDCASGLIGLSNALSWEKDRIPPKFFISNDYEESKNLIIIIQNALHLKNKIIPDIKKRKYKDSCKTFPHPVQ